MERARPVSYSVENTPRFDRELRKLDRRTQETIKDWIAKNLEGCANPRAQGKALSANLKGLWRYRIGNYRLVCRIEDYRLVILAVSVGHRRSVYKN